MKIKSFIIVSLALIGTLNHPANTIINSYGNFIKIQVDQSQIPDPKQNIVHYIRIFDQYQDEYLQNNAVVQLYDADDILITSTQYTADPSKFIILDIGSKGKGMFFTVDQITACLKNPNDPYFYPWIEKCMGDEGINVSNNDYRVLTHRNPNNDKQFYSIAKKHPTYKYFQVPDYGGGNMRYKGYDFNYSRFVLGDWNGHVLNNGPFTIKDSGANNPDERSFYLNYTSPTITVPINASFNIINGGSMYNKAFPSAFTFNHNDCLLIDTDDRCWFTYEDVIFLLKNNLYFNNIGSNNYIEKLQIAVNVNHWNS